MSDVNRPTVDAELCNPQHARWLIGVLQMLIKVVGRETVLGLILGQARSEIISLLRDVPVPAAPDLSFSKN
jgi:hypothetical protein